MEVIKVDEGMEITIEKKKSKDLNIVSASSVESSSCPRVQWSLHRVREFSGVFILSRVQWTNTDQTFCE
jgi:hypothetical protein